MVWARLDDEILDNPKIVRAGPLGFALHVAAITWCCRNLTDGFIPRPRVRALLDLDGALSVAAELIGCGLWDVDEARDGFVIHDFLVYNPTREKVLAERGAKHEAKAEAGRRGAAKRWQGRSRTDGRAMADGMAESWQSDGPVPDPDPVPTLAARESYARAREGSPSAPEVETAPAELAKPEPLHVAEVVELAAPMPEWAGAALQAVQDALDAEPGYAGVKLDARATWGKYVARRRGAVAEPDFAAWCWDQARIERRDRERERWLAERPRSSAALPRGDLLSVDRPAPYHGPNRRLDATLAGYERERVTGADAAAAARGVLAALGGG